MCGRYVVAYDPQTLISGFSLTRIQPFERRWNVAPTMPVPVVYDTREGQRVCDPMRWGLVPHWAKDTSIGAKLNNARVEGVAEKPSFRQALRRRRCILPASGFYEWTPATGADGKPYKQPHYISPTEAPFFAMAGLFEAWRPADAGEDGEWLLTCCVITTAANAVMAPIHDRMPLMLAPEDWGTWLRRDLQDVDALAPLLHARGGVADAMHTWPVARTVSRAGNEGPALIEPIGPSGADAAASAPPASAGD